MRDWNDLKYVLEVLRCGSTLSAAQAMGTSQTTVMRRIAALERELGVSLFDKLRTGYRPTELLKTLAPQLEVIETAHIGLDRDLASLSRGVSDSIRLTAPDLLVTNLLGQALSRFRREHPNIKIELLTCDRFVDLEAGDADLALRASDPSRTPRLFGRRIVGNDTWSFCCNRDYASRCGIPTSVDELGKHSIVTVLEGLFPTPLALWLEKVVPPNAIAIRHNSLSSIHASLKAGLGVGICPDIISSGDTDLVRCFPVSVPSGKEIWLLAPERHRKTEPVRVALNALSKSLTSIVRQRLTQSDWSQIDFKPKDRMQDQATSPSQ